MSDVSRYVNKSSVFTKRRFDDLISRMVFGRTSSEFVAAISENSVDSAEIIVYKIFVKLGQNKLKVERIG